MQNIDSKDFGEVLKHAQLGKEPSDNYFRSLNVLDNVVRECMHLSRDYVMPSPTSRHFYASVLFTTLITRAVSLLNLAPHSTWSQKLIEHWDYASTAVIARTMLEIRLAFYYLCIDECEQSEWECRWNIFNLHDCMARIRLFDAMQNVEQVSAFEVHAEDLRNRLRENQFFLTLQSGQQKSLLTGRTAYIHALEDIGEKAGIEKDQFRYLYVLLSSHVHGLPMSFYRIGTPDQERGRGLPSPVEESYTSLCLSIASSLLTGTRDEFRALFSEFIAAKPYEPTIDPQVQIQEMVKSPETFAIGQAMEFFKSESISVDATKQEGGGIQLRYRHQPSGQVVLERLLTDAGAEAGFRECDPYFWTFLLNGRALTEAMLADVVESDYAISIDHEKRAICLIASDQSRPVD
jgi:hypothetical protein